MKMLDNSAYGQAAVQSEIPNIAKKLTNKTLSKLEQEGLFVFPDSMKDAPDLDERHKVLRLEDGKYYTGNVMGFLGCGKERLTICSRFSTGQQDFFLQYMLDRVLGLPNVLHMDTQYNARDRMLDILMFLFPHYLRIAMRKGLYKPYTHVQYNDENPRGTINIARHIKENTPFTGKIAYDQRTQSLDNELTQLIRHTVEYIRGRQNGNQILALAKNEIKRIVEVTPSYRLHDRLKVLQENKKHTVRHAYFSEYRILQRLCLLILQHQKAAISSGIDHPYGVLFDGAWLWEEYVNSLIAHRFHHPKNKGSGSADSGVQQLFSSDEGKAGRIYPDFIGKDAANRLVADAKYKPVENIHGRDYLQILAYMLRFDARQGYYLYPEKGSATAQQLRLNQGVSYEKNVMPRADCSVIKLGLQIPQNVESYREFVELMSAAEQAFTQTLIATAW